MLKDKAIMEGAMQIIVDDTYLKFFYEFVVCRGHRKWVRYPMFGFKRVVGESYLERNYIDPRAGRTKNNSSFCVHTSTHFEQLLFIISNSVPTRNSVQLLFGIFYRKHDV